MNYHYASTAFETYRIQCESKISAQELPTGSFQRFLLGQSFMKHPIYGYRLGTGTSKLLMTGGVHGRESINSFALLSMLRHYASHFACYGDWFSSHSLYMIPMLNPDGYLLSLSDPHWKNNGRDVDLNRNFPSNLWKKKWNSDTPMSEPETKLLVDFFHQIQPDLYFDIHSRGKGVYYYRSSMPSNYNENQLKLADKISSFLGYTIYPPDQETNPNDSGGNTVQYFSETFQKPAFTIETLDDEVTFPISMSYLSEIFGELLNLILLF